MKSSSRHRGESVFPITMEGGVAIYDVPSKIRDNEMARCENFLYEINTNRLRVRPGIKRYSSTGLANPINGVHVLYDGTDYTVVGSSNGTLYYLDGAKAFQAVTSGTLATATPPVFMNFKNLALVGDGGYLKTWDGDPGHAMQSITGTGAPNAVIDLDTLAGRVMAAGDTTFVDRIFISQVNDQTDFDQAADGEYYDVGRPNLPIKSINLMGLNEIIVHKGAQDKEVYRAVLDPSVAPDSGYESNWITSKFLEGYTCALNARTAITAAARHFFLDRMHFAGYVGSDRFDEISPEAFGSNINASLSVDPSHAFFVHFPLYHQIWLIANSQGKIWVYDYSYGELGRWTSYRFMGDLIPYSGIYHEGIQRMLIGMDDGYIYEMDPVIDTDNGTDVIAAIETKRFGDGIQENLIKETIFSWERVKSGSGSLTILLNDGNESHKLADLVIGDADDFIYDATGYIADATEYINRANYGKVIVSPEWARGENFQYQINVTQGSLRSYELLVRVAKAGRASTP